MPLALTGGDDGESIRSNLKHLKQEVEGLVKRGIDFRGANALDEARRTDKHLQVPVEELWTAELPDIEQLLSASDDDASDSEEDLSLDEKRKDAVRMYESLSVDQLKAELRTRKLPSSDRTKKNLIERLVNARYPKPAVHQQDPPRIDTSGPASGVSAPCSASDVDHDIEARSKLMKLTVYASKDGKPGLRTACALRKLSCEGTKIQLVQRILDYDSKKKQAEASSVREGAREGESTGGSGGAGENEEREGGRRGEGQKK